MEGKPDEPAEPEPMASRLDALCDAYKTDPNPEKAHQLGLGPSAYQ